MAKNKRKQKERNKAKINVWVVWQMSVAGKQTTLHVAKLINRTWLQGETTHMDLSSIYGTLQLQ